MATAPDFSQPTRDLLAQRSAMICNNPDCLSVTVGPYDAQGEFALKLGEAAHICAARTGEARFDDTMTDEGRADHTNGIWLCAHCHGMIDKNQGVEFPRKTIESWKQKHAEMITVLLRSHRSPIAYLRKLTAEGRIAQNIVDVTEQHAALFQDMALENPDFVFESVNQIRKRFNAMIKEIQYDKNLKMVLQKLTSLMREFMNYTGQNRGTILSELPTLRNRVGQQIKILRDNYGCTVPQNVSIILPP